MTATHERATTRRGFLASTGTAAIATTGMVGSLPALARTRRGRQRVAIFGGGIAGLTAAHELAERGFEVTVYERRAWGGKVRSIDVPGTASPGRRALPGEHSHHNIFGGYQHLPETLSRIPFPGNSRGVLDNLVPLESVRMARVGARDFTARLGDRRPTPLSPQPDVFVQLAQQLPLEDALHLLRRLAVFFSSCDARRYGELEATSWWDFLDASNRSEDFRQIVIDIFTRELVAQDPRHASARGIGNFIESAVYVQLGRCGTGPVGQFFNAPKTEAWIDPWLNHLRSLGVKLRLGHAVEGLRLRDGRITGARMRGPRGRYSVEADWFIVAVPMERARALWSRQILDADPRLAAMNDIGVWWTNAMQLYLREPTPLYRDGTVFYIDSPWALISTSRSTLWHRDIAATYGDGSVHEVMAVVISEFDAPGVLYGKPAKQCGPQELVHECWAQMQAHLDQRGDPRLPDDLIRSWHIDPGLRFNKARTAIARNDDPLVSNVAGTYYKRPKAATAIRNLLLAGDWVRGEMYYTSTEGANESARRCVNALLKRSGSRTEPCRLYPLYKPPEWDELRKQDAHRVRAGLPNLLDGPSPAVGMPALSDLPFTPEILSLLPHLGRAA